MASSMRTISTFPHALFYVFAFCVVATAQTSPPRDLWNDFTDRPAARRPVARETRGEPSVDRPRVSAKTASLPKRFPRVDNQQANLPEHAGDTTRETEQAGEEQWWDQEANADADYARPNQPMPSNGRGDLIQSSQIVAIVGNEPILAGDLLGRINEALQPYIGKAPEKELEAKRWELIEQLLPSSIEAKMVYLDFVRKMKPEQIAGLKANIYSQFDEKQLPDLVEKAGVRNVTELEAKMRAVGASLDKTRRLFFEQVAAREVIRRGGEIDRDISPAELLSFYRERIDDYKIEAKVKWEQLTVKSAPGASPDERQRARLRLGKMGNAVVDGVPFATVAERDSQGPTAHEGGKHDWTLQGSLVSRKLDAQIFSLPIGTLSKIIEDDTGFHIVRVVDRENAGHIPFTEAQAGIREQIIQEARDAKIADYLADLKERTYVWNYFESKTAELDKKSDRF